MLTHEATDEEDYECYFLLPVNGYKIADRIKSANQELFEKSTELESDDTDTYTLNLENGENVNQRRVTFRSELEEFEPEMSSMETIDNLISDDDSKNITEIDQIFDQSDLDRTISETSDTTESIDSEQRISDDSEKIISSVDENVEEICEEIQTIKINDPCENLLNVDEKNVEIDIETASNKTVDTNIEQLKTEIKAKIKTSNSLDSILNEYPFKTELPHPIQGQLSNEHKIIAANPIERKRKTNLDEELKFKLNFKTCCEYKSLMNDMLPQYSGYISEYGLSKEQLERRERRRKANEREQIVKCIQTHEEEQLRSNINEAAFSRWLQNKMRNTRNRMKNMFDYRKPKQRSKSSKQK